VVERFTPKPDGRLEWSVTLEDPSTWTKPWTFSMVLARDSEERIMEYACHEGNRAMANTLSGARAEERASQEKGKQTGRKSLIAVAADYETSVSVSPSARAAL
jgi:hypothetical protein